MDYGVKFDILINEVAASTALTKFSNTVQVEVPKIIANLSKIKVPLADLSKSIAAINVELKTLSNTKLRLSTREASLKITDLKRQVKSLQAQLVSVGGAAAGATRAASGAAVAGAGARVGGVGRVPAAGVNLSQMRKSIIPNATFAGVGVPLAAMGVTAMAVGGISYLMKESAQFEDIMQSTRNILRSTDKDASTFQDRFDTMAKSVRQVGIDTKYSSKEVAAATKYLAMAGMDIATIEKSMMPIANLATMSNVDVAIVADVVTNIMAGFKISADSMGAVSDILASTATRSNSTVLELAEGFKFGAGAMSLANISFHEGAAALGVLSNAGIKGTVAGTGMRAMIIRMIKPTKKAQETLDRLGVSFTTIDKNGKESFKTLEKIFQEFRDKKASAEDMYTIFDKIAGTPAVNLLENLDRFKAMSIASTVAGGSAAYFAAEQMKTAVGLTDQIGSKFEDLGLKAYQSIEPYLIELLGGLSNFLDTPEANEMFLGFARGFRTFTETVVDFTKFVYENWDKLKWLLGGTFVFNKVNSAVVAIASTFRLLPGVLSPVASGAAAVGSAVGGAATAGSAFSAVMAPLKMAAIAAGISGIITILGLGAFHLWSSKNAADQLFDSLDKPSTKFRSLEQAQLSLMALKDNADLATKAVVTLTDKVFAAAPANAGWGWLLTDFATEGIAQILDAYSELSFMMVPGAKEMLQGTASSIRGGAKWLMQSQGVYDEAINKSSSGLVTKNVENLMQDLQKVSFAGDQAAYAGVDKTLSTKIDQWTKESKKRLPFKMLSEDISYETRIGMSKEYADDMLKTYKDQYEYISSARQMISSGLFYEAERGFQSLGVLGAGGAKWLMKPGTDIPDPEKVVRFMTDASKANVSKDIIDKAVKTFGLTSALDTTIKTNKEYQPRITNQDLGEGMEGFESLPGSAVGSGGGYSGAGKMKSQSNRNIIVNIENLLNIETAELLDGKESIKDQVVQVLMDAVKDVELAYQ